MNGFVVLGVILVVSAVVILWLNDRLRQRSGAPTPGFWEQSHRRAWRWKGTPPMGFTVVFALFGCHFVLTWLLGMALPFYAARKADALRPAAIHERGGATYFVSPVVGYLVNTSLYVDFTLLAVAAATTWRHRDQLERVAP